MNDEFLHSIRRPPPPGFARDLKRKLHAQEAAASHRSWSWRARTLVFLIVGSAFAGGLYVFERQPVEPAAKVQPSAPVVVPEIQNTFDDGYLARPLNPSFVPEGNGTSSGTLDSSQRPDDTTATDGRSAQSARSTGSASGAASIAPGQTSGGSALLGRQAPPRIATSPLMESLVRKVLGRGQYDIETMNSEEAFASLCDQNNGGGFDLVVTGNRMISLQLNNCQDNGGKNIVELKMGYLALVLTSAKGSVPMKLSESDLYLALAKTIPDPLQPGRFIANPNVTWDQIGRFEYRPIQMFGPARGTPRRTTFEILLLEPGCDAQPAIRELRSTQPERHDELCRSLRTDRTYAEVEQDSMLIPRYLWSDPNPLVLVDYGFYRSNRDQLADSALEGPEPSPESFANGSYTLSRPVYLFVDTARVTRSREVYDAMESLADVGIYGAGDSSFVRLGEEEERKLRLERLRKLGPRPAYR